MNTHPHSARSNSRWAFLAILLGTLIAILLPGCGSAAQNGPREGSAEVLAKVSSALGAHDVTRVAISATKGAITRRVELQQVGAQWRGTIGALPIGVWTFHGDAYAHDVGGAEVLTFTGDGRPEGYEVTAGGQVSVALLLQQVGGVPTPFENSAPKITSFFVSNTNVAPNDQVTLKVGATDPDGDAITFAWTPLTGFPPDSTQDTAVWSSPTVGDYTLTVTVSDTKGAYAAISATIHVSDANARGSADVVATINSWPAVDGILASPTLLAIGDTTTLTASAHDDDGEPLTLAWSAVGCTGAFNVNAPQSPSNPTFKLLTVAAGATTCTVHLVVADTHTGSNYGDLTLNVGAPIATDHGVTIDETYYTAACGFSPSDTLRFRVIAHDTDDSHPTGLSAPVSSAPRGNTVSNVGAAQNAGGKTATYTVGSLPSYSALYWMLNGAPSIRMQGTAPLFTLGLVSVTGSTATWTGTTSYDDGLGGGPISLDVRFTMTLVSGGNLVAPDAALGLSLPSVNVLATGGNFAVKTAFEAFYQGVWQAIGPMRNTGNQSSGAGAPRFFYTNAKSVTPITFDWEVINVGVTTHPTTTTSLLADDRTESVLDWSALTGATSIRAIARSGAVPTVTTFNVASGACP